jgi:type I restriction-modification system DNA methylase subunit
VLDPCCGSGVFLVLAYRRLIERLWREQGERPKAEAMKRLLQENIFGVEKDQEACFITAFSLILTLLSHLEPPELQANADFQFPTLVGSNIFQADFFDDACPIFQKGLRFDWVMGNPPLGRGR